MIDKQKPNSRTWALIPPTRSFVYHTSLSQAAVIHALQTLNSGWFVVAPQCVTFTPFDEGTAFKIVRKNSNFYGAYAEGHVEMDAMGQTVIHGQVDISQDTFWWNVFCTNTLFLLVAAGICNAGRMWAVFPLPLLFMLGCDRVYLMFFINCRDALLKRIIAALDNAAEMPEKIKHDEDAVWMSQS
jgi:hypothetical protein